MRRSPRIQQQKRKRTKEQEERSRKILYSIINPTTETKIDQLWRNRQRLEYLCENSSLDLGCINNVDYIKTTLDSVYWDVGWLKKDTLEYHSDLNSTLQNLTQTIADLSTRLSNLEERLEEVPYPETDPEE